MNRLDAFIARLGQLGVVLTASDGQLHVRAPRGVLSDELREELARRKPDLIAMLDRSSAIERIPRTGALPLSHAQRRLWFYDRLEPGAATFNTPAALRIEGQLDVTALERALSSLVRRHEVLRSTFPSEGGRPRVRIAEDVVFTLERWSLAERPRQDPMAAALELAQREAKRPFDLAEGPLLRAALVTLGPDDHVLVWVIHHIVSDAWSTSIMAAELAELYGSFARGDTTAAAPLPIEYVDVAAWRERTLQGAELERLVAFWRQQLAGAPTSLPLPLDKPRPPQPTRRGATVHRRIGGALHAAARAFGKGEEATLFMTLLAAWNALLHRYTGEEDIVVGTPVSGRTRRELEALIGLFVNMVPLRVDASGDPSFRELVRRVKDRSLAAIAHSDLPFERLVELLSPERDASRSPVFQVAFILQNAPRATFEASGLRLTPFDVDTETAKLDLSVTAVEEADGIACSFEYAIDLFEPTTIARMAGHFEMLLSAALDAPNAPISRLPLMRADERADVLRASAPEWEPRPIGALVHERFADVAAASPTAIAIVHEEERITYAELDARSSRLAQHLRALGVDLESRVALLLPRSVDLIVAVIGILKAGGGYVPLDPEHPAARLEQTLTDARPALLVTNAELAAVVGAATIAIVRVDADRETIDARPPVAPPRTAKADSLAYVLYTSGSTGTPKGTEVTHANVARLFDATSVRFDFHAGDVWALCHSIAFDFSVWEMWGALLYGGRLVIVPRATSRAVDELWALLVREGVTVLNQTPSAFYALARVASANRAPHLRWIIFGGEALDLDALSPWFERHSDEMPKLVNMYGITETTVHVTWHRVRQHERGGITARESPIGRPLPDLGVYILDRHEEPVPFGVPGEIYVSGGGVARGYFDRPALDSERFIANPFGSGRLYRSGDRARRRSFENDGTELWYSGRLDDQVKVRGHRIELGEIEATLAAHPGVVQAAVILRDDPPIGQRLAAYLVVAKDAPTDAELLAFAKARLPEPMRPSAFVRLAALPLTPNGKLDRRALPKPERERPSLETVYAGARTEHEQTVATIWASLLGVAQVGLHDNFFDLGGHSLLMVEVQARLEATTGRSIPLVVLFQHPTVAALAAHLSQTAEERPAPDRGRRRGVDRTHRRDDSGSIAVIGMALRFPGAEDANTFWQNLRNGVESIRFLSDSELLAGGVEPSLFRDPRYVRANSTPDDVECFDASFFGYSPREAELLDPQQRFFLECAWHALEDAALDSDRFSGRIGLFAGAGISRYLLFNLSEEEVVRQHGELALLVANDKDYLATRAAYKLNLRGPSVTVQTACSTSLVAVHHAVQSLLTGESDVALAGGVSLEVRKGVGYLHTDGSIASPDGHCRAFDARARGTVGGSGAGVVVLKRLADAERDGDRIVSVIRATAVNNDGAAKVGFTAPSIDGQAEVIAEAIAAAGISARDVGFVEAHGTATALGDPIEVAALTQAFRLDTDDVAFCALGSVKTNIGHLDAAAGVAGLIKASLALAHGEIPPSLHFEAPNPAIPLATTPFRVATALTPWPADERPRRAGVSSFGLGGTNAHAILEEAPPAPERSPETQRPQLLLLSGRSRAAVDAVATRLAQRLEQARLGDPRDRLRLDDVAHTLNIGRRALLHRRFIVSADTGSASAALALPDPERTGTAALSPCIVIALHGEDASRIRSTSWRSTFDREPAFREAVERCVDALHAHAVDPTPLLSFFDDAPLAPATSDALAAFVVCVASLALWRARGVVPTVVVGAGAGELAAAHVTGQLTLEDAIAEVARGDRREADAVPLARSPASVAGGVATTVAAIATAGDHVLHLGLELGLERVEADGTRVSLISPDASRDPWRLGLEVAGHLWLTGVRVDAAPPARRVRLPGYPFERQRYWIEPRRRDERSSDDARRWLHVPVWQRATVSHGNEGLSASLPMILFADDVGLGDALATELNHRGARPIVVRPGRRFERTGDDSYVVDPRSPESVDDLFSAIGSASRSARLVYMWPVTREPTEPHHALELGFFALLTIAQAWSRASIGPLDLVVAGTHLDDVLGSEEVSPEKATIVGLCRSIPFELPGSTARIVGVHLPAGDGSRDRMLVTRLLREIIDERDEHVALRGPHRWIRNFAPLELSADPTPRLRPRGTYLITGGLGGIGLLLAEHIAREAQATLVLVGRSTLPPRAAWAEWVQAHPDDPISTTLRRLQAIEALGSRIQLESADVTDKDSMRAIKDRANTEFGPIRGVVHAAGVTGGGLLGRLTRDQALRALGPKVFGTRVLLSLFEDGPAPDFILLCAALSGVLGGFAQVDYAAANTALDAFAWSHARGGRYPVLSVDWTAWSGIGMAARSGEASVTSGASPSFALAATLHRSLALTPAEGVDVFKHVLSAAVPQVLVARDAPAALAAKARRVQSLAIGAAQASAKRRRAIQHPRPELGVPFAPPRDALERSIASVWEDTLGIGPLGINDEFFALGGDSMLGVTLAAQLEATLGTTVPITAFLNGTTIERLASVVRSQREGSLASTSTAPARSLEGRRIVPFRAGGTRTPPLVLVHAVAGTVACYRALADQLRPGRTVLGLGAVGLAGEVAPIDRIPKLAKEHVRALRAEQPTGPYALAGWSMGGLLAHEMAHQLHAAGEAVSGVIIVDMGAPALVRALLGNGSAHESKSESANNASLIAHFIQDVAGIFGVRLDPDGNELAAVPEPARFSHALALMRSSNALPSSVDDAEVARLFAVFQAHVIATRTYDAPAAAWPVTLLKGAEGMLAPCPDATWGWSALVAKSSLEVRTIPGDHYSLLAAANVARLAAEIDRALAATDR